ncbi:MAG: efflux RND transporter periplasmic adaptor subunit [Clostridia bacterium]|nr:efflux RND transporter periplasmic adaptor subunit [Clostridia bacterium]MBQ9925761.1 efflux RND transporter periplasmic adaptor subunit [Clostridia bacterium]
MAEKTAVTDYVTLKGTIVERCRRDLYPKSLSRIQEIYVSPGESVAKGQVMMRLQTQGEEAALSVFYAELQEQLQTIDETWLPNPGLPSVPVPVGTVYDLISPIDGTIMEINGKAGECVSGVFPCITVSDLNQLGVSAEVSEENCHLLKKGMECRISVPSAGSATYHGYLSGIAPFAATASILEQNTGVHVAVEAEISDPVANLRPGYSADMQIRTGPAEQAIIVPYHCVAQDEKGEYILYIAEDRTLVRSDVQTGRELVNGLEILSGLTEGQGIIENPEQYKAGEQVRLS